MLVTSLDENGVIYQHSPHQAPLKATLNTVPVHAWYALPNGALTFVNERIADYLGLPGDHPLRFGTGTGADWDSHIPRLHADDREETRRVWSNCIRTGCAGEVSFRLRDAEGGYRWFLSRAEPVRSANGTLLYWIGVNLDIEERKQAEFYLAEGQRLAHTGIWAFNAAGFNYWSSELFQIYGLDPSGKPPTVEEYLELVHPEDREFLEQGIQNMLADHCGFDFTKRIVRSDGEIRYVRCVGVPLGHGVTFKGFVGTGVDVTEQEQMTKELQRREAYLTEAQRLSRTGSLGWKTDKEQIVWSDETYRIFEYDRSGKPTADAPAVRSGGSAEGPRTPISRHVCGRAVACRCADRSRVSVTRPQKCSNFREALCPVGSLETGAAGSRCAQDVGHKHWPAGTPRAHEKKAVCIQLILQGSDWCWRGELNPHAG